MQWGRYWGDRIVLPDDLGEADVEEAAKLMNAEQVRDTTASVEFGCSREITWHLVAGYYFHYGLQHPAEIGFVFTSGPVEAEVGELTEMLREYFEPPEEEILAEVEHPEFGTSTHDMHTTRRKLVRLGLAAPKTENARYFDKIVSAMRSEDDAVREAGLWAATYACWPRLLPEVDSLALDEPNSDIRSQASALAKYMRQEGIAS